MEHFTYGFLFGALLIGCIVGFLMYLRCEKLLKRKALMHNVEMTALRTKHAQDLITAKMYAVNAERALVLRRAALKSAIHNTTLVAPCASKAS